MYFISTEWLNQQGIVYGDLHVMIKECYAASWNERKLFSSRLGTQQCNAMCPGARCSNTMHHYNTPLSFAVVTQYYEAEVVSEYVIRGNAAILKCTIPSFVAEFVSVESWVGSDGSTFRSSTDYGTYMLFVCDLFFYLAPSSRISWKKWYAGEKLILLYFSTSFIHVAEGNWYQLFLLV